MYAFYTKVDNKAGATYMTGAAGQDFSSLALGVRHKLLMHRQRKLHAMQA